MKRRPTVIFAILMISFVSAGHTKVFDDDQLNCLFQADDTVPEINLKPSDILESASQDRAALILLGLKIDLVHIINSEMLFGTVSYSNSTSEKLLEESFSDIAFNGVNFFELKTINENMMFTETNLWASVDLLLNTNGFSNSFNLLRLSVAR